MRKITRFEIDFSPFEWSFAEQRREDIEANFAARKRATPEIWNGRVLLMRDFAIDGEVLRGSYFETSYAAFIAWHDWKCPDPAVVNLFPVGALRASDGGFLMGVMNDHTANAGHVCFASGMPDLDDVTAGTVDLMGSILREVEEETGLTVKDFSIGTQWHAVDTDYPHLILFKPLRLRCPAEEAKERIMRHLALEAKPELKEIRIVRTADDFDAHMSPSTRDYLGKAFRSG